jgi:hypothetical protein
MNFTAGGSQDRPLPFASGASPSQQEAAKAAQTLIEFPPTRSNPIRSCAVGFSFGFSPVTEFKK